MKLATYKDGSRDGQLVVVSRDLHTAHFAAGIATRLQQVLDDWNFLSPQLEDLYTTLNQGRARHAFPFEPRQCMAPLPRAFQWADGSAYLSHAERLAQARGEALPETLREDPLMYQGGSDDFLGPRDNAWFGSATWGIDYEAELAVITGDVAMGANAEQGLDGIRLLMLANDWSLRELIPRELAKGFGFLHGKPATGFAPVAVTPDEFGEDWRNGRLSARLLVKLNGRKVAQLDTGEGMHFHFGQLVAHLAKTRNVRAGSIVGSGTISRADAKGFACLAERRAHDLLGARQATLAGDQPELTPWLALGDTVTLSVTGRNGQDLFGTLEQRVWGPGMDEVEAQANEAPDEPGDDTRAAADAPDDAAVATSPYAAGEGPSNTAARNVDRPEADEPGER